MALKLAMCLGFVFCSMPVYYSPGILNRAECKIQGSCGSASEDSGVVRRDAVHWVNSFRCFRGLQCIQNTGSFLPQNTVSNTTTLYSSVHKVSETESISVFS
jgi:hypothetical protein